MPDKLTSEDLLELPKPPSFMCSKIDKWLEETKTSDWYASDTADALEELREALEALRLWGSSWKDLAKEQDAIKDQLVMLKEY